jgi:hypothetical protein
MTLKEEEFSLLKYKLTLSFYYLLIFSNESFILKANGKNIFTKSKRGPKKHLKRIHAPKHWLLSKVKGIWVKII